MPSYPVTDSVRRIYDCDLRLGGARWDYENEHRAAIEAAWQVARTTHPAYFNGAIHLIDDLQRDGRSLAARLLRTDFKTYLHWRTAGYPETGVLDGFGSALLLSNDNAIVLGRQRAGNINGGLAYLPGGFIDARDVRADQSIDITGSVARELCEETGLTAADVTAMPGFLLTETGAHVSFAVVYRAKHDAASLKQRIERHIATDPHSELTDAVIVRSASDMTDLPMPRYALVLVAWLLSQPDCGVPP